MKTFFKVIFILIFASLSVLFLLSSFIVFNKTDKEEIKTELRKSGVYTQSAEELKKNLENTSENDTQDETDAMLSPVLKLVITDDYIQGKTETFIDDMNDWIINKTETPPVVSFSDIRDKLLSQNPEIKAQLEQMQKEEMAQQITDQNTDLATNDETADQETTPIEINQLMKSDFSLPVGKNLTWLKTTYQYSKLAFPVTGVLLLLLLAGIILLSENKVSKLRWTGSTFLVSVFWNVLPLLVIFLSSKAAVNVINDNDTIPSYAVSLVNVFIPLLADKYIKFAGIVLIVLFVISILCFVFSSVFHETPKVAAAPVPVTKIPTIRKRKKRN